MHFLWRNGHQWAEVLFWSFARYGALLFLNGQKNKIHGFLQWFPHCILQWIPRIWAQLNIFDLFYSIQTNICSRFAGKEFRSLEIIAENHGFCFSAHCEKKCTIPTKTSKKVNTSAHWWRFRQRKCIYGQHFVFVYRPHLCTKLTLRWTCSPGNLRSI